MDTVPYRGQDTYTVEVAGRALDLPVVAVKPGLWIAAFVLLGDVGVTRHCARGLASRLGDVDFDIIAGPEAKVIPLLHALAEEIDASRYVVCRKAQKGYMTNPVAVDVESITTSHQQRLVLDEPDANRVQGRRVVMVDDVVSTGGTMRAMERLLVDCGAEIAGRAAVLKEGEGFQQDLIHLGEIPLFVAESD